MGSKTVRQRFRIRLRVRLRIDLFRQLITQSENSVF
jgi:hypothetical protein